MARFEQAEVALEMKISQISSVGYFLIENNSRLMTDIRNLIEEFGLPENVAQCSR